SYQLFGVHDWAARLVPLSAGIIVVLTTYCWARWTAGARAAFLCGLMVCLSGKFLYLAGMVGMDSLLCVWVIGGLAWGHAALALVPRFALPWMLSAVCCGLGVMTKGPVAAVLVVVPLAAWTLVQKRTGCRRRVSLSAWLVYGGVLLLVASPWYVALCF